MTENSELDCYLTLTESKGFLFLFAVFLQIFPWTSILSLAKLLLQRPHWTNPGLGANFAPADLAVLVLLVVKYCPAGLALPFSHFSRLSSVGGFLCWYSCFPPGFRLLDTLLGSWTWRKGPIRYWVHGSEKYTCTEIFLEGDWLLNFLVELFLFAVNFDLSNLSMDLLNLSLWSEPFGKFSIGSKGDPLSLPFLKHEVKY